MKVRVTIRLRPPYVLIIYTSIKLNQIQELYWKAASSQPEIQVALAPNFYSNRLGRGRGESEEESEL
jgi:hypothetical protein